MVIANSLRIELKHIIATLKLLVPMAGSIFLFRVFVMDLSIVQRNSMEPTLHSGDIILVEKISGLFRDFTRGEIIQVFDPVDHTILVKRIVGLPGEAVSGAEDQTFIVGPSGLKQTLNEVGVTPDYRAFTSRGLHENEFFVTGDNRHSSRDSRDFGPVHRAEIIGRVTAVWKLHD